MRVSVNGGQHFFEGFNEHGPSLVLRVSVNVGLPPTFYVVVGGGGGGGVVLLLLLRVSVNVDQPFSFFLGFQ